MNLLKDVNIKSVQEKLHERLKSSGWGDKLRTFIMSNDFEKILNELHFQAMAGKRFTPVLKQVFRCLEECPHEKLKVVILAQDPYPYINVADGLAFSCSNTGRIQASLKFILQEVEKTVYSQSNYNCNPDLKHWANQGVLLLNTSLTTTIGKVGVHFDIWQPFIAFLFDLLSHDKNIIYVFMGKKAQTWIDLVPDTSIKLVTTHPAFAAHMNWKYWDSGDVFNKVNIEIEKTGGNKIIW